MEYDLNEKVRILVESAKYDVSCSSSGSKRSNQKGEIGNTAFSGICHSFTSDGRCVSLLKILMTNKCCYECLYCVNRHSNDVPRASLEPAEICELVMNFYKRNYIEGLFLSSAIENNPDYTMEKLLKTVVMLRTVYHFNGYIHVKGIPSADKKLLDSAGLYADRMSFNIELPSEKSLKLLAPQKSSASILNPMKDVAENYLESLKNKYNRHKFLPAGQTTQMIVGASPESDGLILRLTENLYDKFKLKRVYYSSYAPTNTSSLLPQIATNQIREHRLYQADWLLRFYGFKVDELIDENENLQEEYDPKMMWALKNPALFPIEINTCEKEMLMRIPGIGLTSAYRILSARKFGSLNFTDLAKMNIVLKRAKHFITCNGKFMGLDNYDIIKNTLLIDAKKNKFEQLSMFSTDIVSSVISGQL